MQFTSIMGWDASPATFPALYRRRGPTAQCVLARHRPITYLHAISTDDRFSTYAGVAFLVLRNAHLSNDSAVEKTNYSRPPTTIIGQLQSLAVREWPWDLS